VKYLSALLLFTFLQSALWVEPLSGQNSSKKLGSQKTRTSSSFTFGDILANPLKDGSLVEARVSQFALTAFHDSYQNVSYSQWYRVRRNYLVYFKANKYTSRAIYDVKGNLVSSFFYGSEQDLPGGIRELVKASYPEYHILLAIEVYEGKEKIWVVNLSSDRFLLSISVENDFIQKISKYRKSK
jgi:hypothetical protein